MFENYSKMSHLNVCSTLPSHSSTFWRDGFIQITTFGQQKTTFSRIYVGTVDFCMIGVDFCMRKVDFCMRTDFIQTNKMLLTRRKVIKR